MQSILESELVFAEFCPDAPHVWCSAANLRYSSIFSAGSFGNLGASFLFGAFLDRYFAAL